MSTIRPALAVSNAGARSPSATARLMTATPASTSTTASPTWAWVEPARATLRRPWLGEGGRWDLPTRWVAGRSPAL